MLVVLASASSSGAAGTALRGEEIYARCLACHALAYNRTGPRHCGLFGRRAGSLPDYGYSDAMRESGIVWDAATLDRFLAAPTRVVPGTTMGYAGIPDPAERAALIEWLRETSRPGTACPENP
ncbi:putative cytochrome c [Aromatoleum aromaticum EbN1]|uniref:Cytochrome c n=1 Tax=Aromatoleum aromaticum (strain DSM 19018 / LMG 30748 / EbN1) TaxID=76114 RepID=Q5NZC9_AROAE|nr:putative cytochrome c [Aromatoleum aromaticum EbN1]